MIKEFVPYAEALELKQLGFDEPCFVYWVFNNVEITFSTTDNRSGWSMIGFTNSQMSKKAGLCTAPTYSQAFRWFRKKYKLWGNIGMQASDYYTLMVYETLPDCCWILYNNKGYETDEEAELACLRELISTVKQRP